MPPPFLPLHPCCGNADPEGPIPDVAYTCNRDGWECPPNLLCMYRPAMNDDPEMCCCASKDAYQTKLLNGWISKTFLARLDKPGRELAALVPPRPIPYPATPAQQMELEVASGKYSQRHVSRFTPPSPENPWGWQPDRFFPNEDCDGDTKRYCTEYGTEILEGIPPCGGGVSSCGDCSPPVWGCGPERSDEDITASMASCDQLIRAWEQGACYATIQKYLECVGRYNVAAQAYQACLVQRIQCLAKEEQAEKDCRSMRMTVWRTAIGLCMQANGCGGWWGKFSGMDDNGIRQYERLPQS